MKHVCNNIINNISVPPELFRIIDTSDLLSLIRFASPLHFTPAELLFFSFFDCQVFAAIMCPFY